jgi:hypothetical protein
MIFYFMFYSFPRTNVLWLLYLVDILLLKKSFVSFLYNFSKVVTLDFMFVLEPVFFFFFLSILVLEHKNYGSMTLKANYCFCLVIFMLLLNSSLVLLTRLSCSIYAPHNVKQHLQDFLII